MWSLYTWNVWVFVCIFFFIFVVAVVGCKMPLCSLCVLNTTTKLVERLYCNSSSGSHSLLTSTAVVVAATDDYDDMCFVYVSFQFYHWQIKTASEREKEIGYPSRKDFYFYVDNINPSSKCTTCNAHTFHDEHNKNYTIFVWCISSHKKIIIQCLQRSRSLANSLTRVQYLFAVFLRFAISLFHYMRPNNQFCRFGCAGVRCNVYFIILTVIIIIYCIQFNETFIKDEGSWKNSNFFLSQSSFIYDISFKTWLLTSFIPC